MLTLRDQLAMQAMSVALDWERMCADARLAMVEPEDMIAQHSYAMADAMLRAREQTEVAETC